MFRKSLNPIFFVFYRENNIFLLGIFFHEEIFVVFDVFLAKRNLFLCYFPRICSAALPNVLRGCTEPIW